MSGEATPGQIGALLVGLTMKGERPAEIVGLAQTMRANAVQLSRTFDDVFDTCGTGGDRSGTFNISSAAALVAAAAGLRVAKHGNRSVSSQCGSADVYEALGRQHRRAACRRRTVARERRHCLLLRADISSIDAPCRANPAGARGENRVQSIRTPDQSGRDAEPARRRPEFRADGADCARISAPRIESGVGGTRGRWHRRDVDDRPHQNFRVPRRCGFDVLRAPVGFRASESGAGWICGAETQQPTQRLFARFSPARKDRVVTSCC